MRYREEHSKIKFISTSGHVISFIFKTVSKTAYLPGVVEKLFKHSFQLIAMLKYEKHYFAEKYLSKGISMTKLVYILHNSDLSLLRNTYRIYSNKRRGAY